MGLSTTSPPTPVRTYAEWLRRRTDSELTALLQRRPDLLHPPPDGLADLAARATTPSSVARVLRHLDAWQAAVLEAAAATPGEATLDSLVALLGPDAPPDAITEAVAELRLSGVVWGSDDRLRVVREARVALGPTPGGLAAPTLHPLDPPAIAAALEQISPSERALLDRLVWGPPTGRVSEAAQRPVNSPIGRLLALRLLRVHDGDTVELPREVAWQLREPRRLLAQQPPTTAPSLIDDTAPAGGLSAPGLRARIAAHAAVATAGELVHDVETCAEWAGDAPVRLLRDGGLGVRDLSTLADLLGTTLPRTALLVELAHGAGLVTASGQHTLLPTTAYDLWATESTPRRWATLMSSWRDLPRWSARGLTAGQHVLGPESDWAVAVELREAALGALATVGSGQRIAAERLVAVLGWLRPGWARASWSLTDAVADLWQELQWFGLVDPHGVTTALASADPRGELPSEVTINFPEPVTEVIIQADLTAVAPGPLTADVRRDLRLLADQESRGAGAVFRFAPPTVRRAFDAGWSHERVTQWLADHSATPIPQPLSYLIADTARRHGSVRVGTAWCYVRTEDEAQARTVLAHPGASALGLRAVAPGVLVASAEPDEVVSLLQELGLHPAAEDASGRTLTAPDPVRAPAPRRPSPPPTADPAGTVAALRGHDERQAELTAATDDILETVRAAHEDGGMLRLSYVRSDGTQAHATAVPVRLGAGTVRLTGPEGTWDIPLSRVVAVARLPQR